jgi:uncharacterized integral membrane protein (TIGR00697 family)
MRKRLERMTGRQCIPVWHISRGKEAFLRMCDEYSYVSIGGLVGAAARSKRQMQLERAFPWFIDEAHKRGCKIHGLGYTNLDGIMRYRFDSVDSTAWTIGNRFGCVYKFDGRRMHKIDKPNGCRIAQRKVRELAVNNFVEWCKFQQWAETHIKQVVCKNPPKKTKGDNLMNGMILAVEIIATFGTVSVLCVLFRKEGLIAWVAVATVLANIMTAKTVSIFGLDTTLGTVLFASTFLATDILTEQYGKEAATKAVKIGVASAVAFIVASQLALAYIPSPIDYADGAMRELFSLNLRISGASVLMYFIANYADVLLYERLREKGTKLWVRNNVSTILCNGLENFAFIALAFAGLYSWQDILVIAGSTTLIEMLVAVCDTPFLYMLTRRSDGKRAELDPGRA